MRCLCCCQLSVKAPWTNLIVPAEIVIGTVPLTEAFRYQAPPPLNDIVAGQSASAPPVDQFASDNFQISMSRSLLYELFSVTDTLYHIVRMTEVLSCTVASFSVVFLKIIE